MLNLRSAAPVAAVLFLVVGCQTATVDQTKEKDTLLATDRQWSELVSAGQNPDSILSYWTEDATVIGPGMIAQGKPAIKQMVASSLAMPGFHLSWTPEKAVIARSGDLGYTTGSGTFTMPGPKGEVTNVPMKYLTTWRKEADGRWKCSEDYSCPTTPDTTSASAGAPPATSE
jgi:ketosteroid isomerase-like protein